MNEKLGFRPIPHANSRRLIKVATNIWTLEADNVVYFRPPAQPRYPYTHRSVVIRLQDDSLFVHSPIALTDTIKHEIDAIGTVKYLVSPNNIHHLHMGEWQQAYPEARLYASPGLISKRKDLAFETTLSTDCPEPEWDGQIDQRLFKSWAGWFDELVFFHRESRTVILTDMIMDFDPKTFSKVAQITTQWNQMYRHTPRGIQFVHSFGRASLRRVLEDIRGWEPEHLIVAHSPWQCIDGTQDVANFLDEAFDWLEPHVAPVETGISIAQFSLLMLLILPLHGLIVLTADILYPRLMKADQRQSPSAAKELKDSD